MSASQQLPRDLSQALAADAKRLREQLTRAVANLTDSSKLPDFYRECSKLRFNMYNKDQTRTVPYIIIYTINSEGCTKAGCPNVRVDYIVNQPAKGAVTKETDLGKHASICFSLERKEEEEIVNEIEKEIEQKTTKTEEPIYAVSTKTEQHKKLKKFILEQLGISKETSKPEILWVIRQSKNPCKQHKHIRRDARRDIASEMAAAAAFSKFKNMNAEIKKQNESLAQAHGRNRHSRKGKKAGRKGSKRLGKKAGKTSQKPRHGKKASKHRRRA